MTDEKKTSYPRIPRNNWFLLRDRFKQRTPERVSPSYVASALNMGEASASANIIPPLRAFGLIDDEGKPTDLAYDWRDDSKYADVCKTIFDSTYPQELRDIFHAPGDMNLTSIADWFARRTRSGQAAAKKSAATYVMLFEADLSKAKELKTTKQTTGEQKSRMAKTSVSIAAPAAATAKSISKQNPPSPYGPDSNAKKVALGPTLHVDIQIHISPDSSPEQIEKIFESMAKHLSFKG